MMKKAFITILTLGFVLALGLPSAYAADMDCGDFSTWTEAQKYFEDNGGSPTNNFNDLDRDHDGMACDSLAGAPANWSWATAHPGGTTGGTQGGTQGGQMPATATNYGNGVLVGLVAMMTGVVFFLRNKQRKTNN